MNISENIRQYLVTIVIALIAIVGGAAAITYLVTYDPYDRVQSDARWVVQDKFGVYTEDQTTGVEVRSGECLTIEDTKTGNQTKNCGLPVGYGAELQLGDAAPPMM